MSIRFRFTLLYNAILAGTLFVFGLALYSIQANSTLDSIKKELLRSSETLGSSVLRTATTDNLQQGVPDPASGQPSIPAVRDPGANPVEQNPPGNPPSPMQMDENPPPKPFTSFSSDQAFKYLPEREVVRVLDATGNLVASPYGRKEDALPLGDHTLTQLQDGKSVWETGEVQGQDMLIYNRPVMKDGEVKYILQVARSLMERNHSLLTLRNTLLLATLITLVVAFGIGWLFSGIVLEPINRITKTAQLIGDERDFSKRVDYHGPHDEVGELAGTMNSMLSRLQDAYQQVADTLIKQREFMADVSHELRTPLTTLRGNLGLLVRKPPLPDDEQADVINDMVGESDRMIRLVNELLRLAHADAGRNLQNIEVRIFPIIEETCRQMQKIAISRKVDWVCSDDLIICGDPDAFKQILLILLDNSVKHSSGDINVSAYSAEGQIFIEVTDSGKGIKQEDLSHVFDRFFRAEEESTKNGFGLGLPIAKSLTEGMGGSIKIDSQSGKGCHVILSFNSL